MSPRNAGQAEAKGGGREQRIRWLLLLLACGLGFALRVWRLDAQPFWFDEGLSVDLALAPPRYVLETIDRPPLYYLSLHHWENAAGLSPFTLRFFSAARSRDKISNTQSPIPNTQSPIPNTQSPISNTQ